MGKLQHGEECGLVIGAKAATMAAKVVLDLASSTAPRNAQKVGSQPCPHRCTEKLLRAAVVPSREPTMSLGEGAARTAASAACPGST